MDSSTQLQQQNYHPLLSLCQQPSSTQSIVCFQPPIIITTLSFADNTINVTQHLKLLSAAAVCPIVIIISLFTVIFRLSFNDPKLPVLIACILAFATFCTISTSNSIEQSTSQTPTTASNIPTSSISPPSAVNNTLFGNGEKQIFTAETISPLQFQNEPKLSRLSSTNVIASPPTIHSTGNETNSRSTHLHLPNTPKTSLYLSSLPSATYILKRPDLLSISKLLKRRKRGRFYSTDWRYLYTEGG
jgi:hypothetical protein